MRSRGRFFLASTVVGLFAVASPSCGGGNSNGNGSGANDGGGDAFGTDAHFNLDGSASDGSNAVMCEEQCPGTLVCDHGFCEPPQPTCVSNTGCEYDSYCSASGQCVPYGSLPDNKTSDPSCMLSVPAGVVAPKTFCEFNVAPAGDPFPQHIDVQSTPTVARFNGPSAPPSIVVPFTAPVTNSYTETLGIIRVLSGLDCSLQANLGGVDLDGDSVVDWINSPSAPALGDLDGDGAPEIVAFMGDRTTVAFTFKAGMWKPLWSTVKATTNGTAPFVCMADGTGDVAPGSSTTLGIWSGPSIHDIDDDGKAEIIREGYVIDGQTGVVRAQLPATYASYSVGIPPVLAQITGDGSVELTNGAHIWQFDGTTNTWTANAAYDAVTSGPGWAAVADFNPYDGLKHPEIVVASDDTLSIYDLSHGVFMMMSDAVPGTGGGPPTVADFDGDGLPEVGLAGKDFYTVFDPDCQATPRQGGMCANRTDCDDVNAVPGACPDHILWSRKTQDHSSDITGSSVFDFSGSGVSQVVYGDECFARVFDGRNGNVLFSQYHSSCTWIENPIVADVDGDFRAELVVPSNTACGPTGVGIDCSGSLDATGADSTYPGLICQTNADCFSGTCDNGLCRCTTTSQCCSAMTDAECTEEGYNCLAPPAGTPGTGNTCRAVRPHAVQGIRVYKDAKDRWVRSRTIWNQHAYAVTHVNEDGTIPKTSAWADNWTTPGLDNFRQNVPGQGNGQDIGDLTAQAGPDFTCQGSSAAMSVPICNRGSAPVGANIPVGFYVGTTKVCSATTPTAIQIGACVNVTCTWSAPPTSMASAVDVKVVANDGSAIQECDTTNDDGLVEQVFCTPPP
jgi:hypothetical protein